MERADSSISNKKVDESKEAGQISASAYTSLVHAARDGQKGIKAAAEQALQIVHEAKNPDHTYGGKPLIDYIARELKNDEQKSARLRYDKDGKLSKIEIKPDSVSRTLPDFVIDVKNEKANGLNAKQLHEASIKEALEYVDRAVNAKNRPIPEFIDEKRALTQSEKQLLLKVEQAAVNGDVNSLVKIYQSDPGNEALWQRLSAETVQDLGYPAVFEFKRKDDGTVNADGSKNDDGTPYLIINNRLPKFIESGDSTVVFASGAAQVLKYDMWDRIEFNNPSGRSVEEAADQTRIARLEGIREQLSLKRCDYDQWERKPGAHLGKTGVKELIERYNSHKDHPCEPDETEEEP